jgi:hypothetical protein
MKLTKEQLKDMIKEELDTLNESVSMKRVVDLISIRGLDDTNWNEYIVHNFGEENVNAARKLIPQLKKFEKNTADMLRKIKNDKMYLIYLEMISIRDEMGGGRGRKTLESLLSAIAATYKI